VSNLARQISKLPKRFRPQREVLTKLFRVLKKPYRDTVLEEIPSAENGIDKKEWLQLFDGKGEFPIDLVFVFHNISMIRMGNEIVNFD